MANSWNDLPIEEVLPGIKRQVVQGDKQTMVRYLYAPGSVFPVHQHPQEQVTVVVSGQILFTVNGEDILLGPGGVAVIPSEVPHGAKVIGEELVETFNSMSPKREVAPTFSTPEEQ